MKNFSTFLTRKQMNKIISAHEMGMNFGSSIEENILSELNKCNLGRKGRYLANLEISDDAKKFIDDFITDVKNYEQTGEGSVYARNFTEN
jgi:ribulose bisphosphate carboxylase small subunit